MPSLTWFLLPTLAAAHFKLNGPVPVGPFVEDKEPTAPCGGVNVDFSADNVTDFHVGGEPVAVFLGHPTANWLFRATLDEAAGSNWTQLYPILTQSGIGDYCQPAVVAPEGWAGKQGILGVVADAPDGLLYQCAAVKFVSGSGTQTSSCKNGTSVSATFSSDHSLSALVGSDSSTVTGTASGTASSTSSSSASSSSSSSKNMAPGLAPPLGGLAASLGVVVVAGLLGAGLVV